MNETRGSRAMVSRCLAATVVLAAGIGGGLADAAHAAGDLEMSHTLTPRVIPASGGDVTMTTTIRNTSNRLAYAMTSFSGTPCTEWSVKSGDPGRIAPGATLVMECTMFMRTPQASRIDGQFQPVVGPAPTVFPAQPSATSTAASPSATVPAPSAPSATASATADASPTTTSVSPSSSDPWPTATTPSSTATAVPMPTSVPSHSTTASSPTVTPTADGPEQPDNDDGGDFGGGLLAGVWGFLQWVFSLFSQLFSFGW